MFKEHPDIPQAKAKAKLSGTFLIICDLVSLSSNDFNSLVLVYSPSLPVLFDYVPTTPGTVSADPSQSSPTKLQSGQ